MLQNLQSEFALHASLSGLNRHQRAISFFKEVLIRLCLTTVAVYRINGLPDPKINRVLLKLSQPSLGDWNNILNMILKWSRRTRGDIRHRDLLNLIQTVTGARIEDPDFVENYKTLIEALPGSPSGVTGLPFRAFADATIRLRNIVAHGGQIEEPLLNRTADAIEHCLRIWARVMPLLSDYTLETEDESRAGANGAEDMAWNSVVLSRSGRRVLSYDFLIVARDGLFFNMNGHLRQQKAQYVNQATGRLFEDVGPLLKKQIVFFAALRNIEVREEDLGSRIATSLTELSRIIRDYKYDPEKKILGGDFQLMEEIGRGGMGIVYRALQISRNRVCAVKVLPRSIVFDQTIFQRFQREAATLEDLAHPGVVEFIAFGETEEDAFLAMEYIDGVSLDRIFTGLCSMVGRRPREEDVLGLLDPERMESAGFAPENRRRPYYYKIVEWVAQAAEALSVIHGKGITHRDLKHANIMIERESGRAVLLDFGLSRNHEATLTVPGQFLGTMRFSAPELLQIPAVSGDERSDIYSLGILFYEFLALRPSFLGDNTEQLTHQILHAEPAPLKQVNAFIPVDLQTITSKCIEKNPERRYRAAALGEDLSRWSRNLPITARPPGMLQRALKWVRANPSRAAALGTAAGALLVIAGIVSYFFVRLVDENIVTRRAIVEARSENAQAFFSVGKEFEAAVAALQAGRVAVRLGTRGTVSDRQMALSALYRVHFLRNEGAWYQDLFNTALDVKVSPDGRYLAVANEEFKRINIFRLEDATELHQLEGHTGPVNAVAFGPDDLLASAGDEGVLRLWRWKAGEFAGELKGHRGGVRDVAFGPGGELASAGVNGEILFWNPETKKILRRMDAHRGAVKALAFARDGTLATGGVDGRVRLWSASGSPLKSFPFGSAVFTLDFDHTGERLASGHADGSMILRDLKRDTRRTHSIATGGPVRDLAFSPDGSHLLISSGSENVVFWRVADGTVQKQLKNHVNLVNAVDFDPLGRFGVAADENGSLKLWRFREGDIVEESVEHAGAAYDIKFSPNGRWFASAGDDGRIKLRSADGKEQARVFATIPGQKIMFLEFSPDSRRLMAGSWNTSGGAPVLRVWDVANGREIHDFPGHRVMVYSSAFSPNGKYIASASFVSTEPELFLWDASSGKRIWNQIGHENSISGVRFSRDGKYLLTSGLDNRVNVRNPSNGEVLSSFELPVSLSEFAVDPKNEYMVGGGYDGKLDFRRLSDGKQLRVVQAHRRVVIDLVFSPDGRYLVTASFDRTIKIWDLKRGEPRLALTLYADTNPWSVAFSPEDPGVLYSSDSAGRIQRWPLHLDLKNVLERACSPAVRNYLVNYPNLSDPERALCDG